MAKKADCTITFPNGERLEIHDKLTTSALLGLAKERDDAVQALYDLLHKEDHASRERALSLLKFHGRNK
jgi:hypothetical protein